ncbi:glycosyltransferase family 2 protein [Flavobacterium undicola]|uniref:glycosyltransferase family 2 protein n=1 Tax=Flavobacterium undicola TaxID=1932779 RepID=UPI001376AFDC|nr:glycosyltransferase [Flavobacterium undicola]MBA0884751.1 glycosyltransferase [Flavobacterium undicola]
MNKLVSIIIPTYNRGCFIEETLASVLAQTYTNWECIVVDDGSNDNTEEIVCSYIEKDKRFKYFHRPQDQIKGPSYCRNYGFKRSVGEYIYWFDSDDILLSEALEKRISCFDDDVDVVIGKAEFFDSDSKVILFRNIIMSNNLIQDYFIGKVTFYVSGPLWKKKFLLEHYLFFDEKTSYLDDWDFNLRALYKVPNIFYLNEVLFRYRSHAYSLSKQVNFLNIEELLSECFTRNKHYVLLKKYKMLNTGIRLFMLDRYRVILRDVLMANERRSSFFYFNLIKLQLQNKKIWNFIKSTLGFIIYKIFKKGYVLIK